jgi:hypothetical protein
MNRKIRMKTISSILVALSSVFALSVSVFAANPNQGTLNPGSATPLQWDGDAIGAPAGGPAGELTCQDGTNCDVFTIHLNGSPSDYAGKQLLIKITFLAVSDYDLYVHKDTLAGKTVFSGENSGPPGTSEQVVINPATSGAGDYVVHVLYATAVPGDQYHGTAAIVSAATATPPPMRTANYI